MRRLLAAALLAATAIVPSAARAADPQVVGGCFFDPPPPVVSGGVWEGVLGDRSATFDADGLPLNATITCAVRRNGQDVATAAFSGFAVQAGAEPVAFALADDDVLALCQRNDVAGVTGTWTCREATPIQPPPPPDDIDPFLSPDPLICPILREAPGTYPGGVVIAADGDVYVPDPAGRGLNPVQDCPPYGNY